MNKLNLIRCPKCKGKTNVLRDFKSVFLEVRFITTWYKCLACTYTFPRKITKEKNYGKEVRNLV